MQKYVYCLGTLLALGLLIVGNLLIAATLSRAPNENDFATGRRRQYIQQNGDYWMWHNFIIGSDEAVGNDSVTLATHATYADLGLLPGLLERWQGPISIAIFASGTDFQKTIESLSYIKSCSAFGEPMERFLSIHLVIHSKHLPGNLEEISLQATSKSENCSDPAVFENANQEQTYWHRHGLKYPDNLLRNMARINILTYYVLLIDIQLLPSPNFPKKFLEFIWNHDSWRFADIRNPYTTVFCLPTFHHKPGTPLVETKSQLVQVLSKEKHSRPTYIDKKQREMWLMAPNPMDEFFIFSRSATMEWCVAYVAINELEPLYDELAHYESIFDRGKSLKGQMLLELNYTFVVLDGPFLLYQTSRSWQVFTTKGMKRIFLRPWSMSATTFQFYLSVLSSIPDGFALHWYKRSSTSLYYQTMMKQRLSRIDYVDHPEDDDEDYVNVDLSLEQIQALLSRAAFEVVSK